MVLLESMQFLHALGIAWGVGGVTIAAILGAKAEKDPALAPLVSKAMPAISKLIWLALILLLVSGVVLVPLITWPMNMTLLWVKHGFFLLLVVNGVLIGVKSSKAKNLAPKKGRKPSREFLKARKCVKACSVAGLVLWYLVMVLSVIM